MQFYQLRSELLDGSPAVDNLTEPAGTTISCPCGGTHSLVVTAYGMRAQCDTLQVRWTSCDGDTTSGMRMWMAEPYVTMSHRSTS